MTKRSRVVAALLLGAVSAAMLTASCAKGMPPMDRSSPLPLVAPAAPSVMHATMRLMGALDAFTAQKTGNLAAVMLYADRDLAETTRQLAALNTSLNELEAALRAQPADERSEMIIGLDAELVAAVRSAVQTYQRYHEISVSNPAIWTDPQVRQEMQTLAAGLTQTRNRIEAAGIGVQSALLAPTVMAVQVAAYARAGVAKPTLKSHVSSYRGFFTRIASADSGGLSHTHDRAKRAHDAEIVALKGNVLMARSPIENFLWSGNQKAASTTDPCVVFPTITWQPLDSRGGMIMNETATEMAKRIGRAIARNSVVAREDTVLRTKLLRYDDGPAGYGAPNTPFSVFARVGDYCYVNKVSSLPGVEAAFAAARSWRTKDDASRGALVTGLERANQARGVVAVTERGKRVMPQVIRHADIFLSIP